MAQQVTKESVPGVTNFTRLETTVACAGATKVEAVPEIKKLGFASIINLREATEPDANVDAEAAAAKTAGIRFYHVPFNGAEAGPRGGDAVPRRNHHQGQRAGFHSLRRRQPRRRDVDDQASCRRSLGRRTRRGGSDGARPHQRRLEAVRDRLRAVAQALTRGAGSLNQEPVKCDVDRGPGRNRGNPE